MTTADGYGILGAPEFDRSPLEFRTYTPPVSGRYRAMPLTWEGHAESRYCADNEGHVLTVEGREITCTRCPARWRDEGY